tara:strand:+ start:160 stop:309 length:150 start_codon:yes stop_codon:yes gene_type:complete
MPKVTYITPSGENVVVEDAIGNLMEIALEYDIEGSRGLVVVVVPVPPVT